MLKFIRSIFAPLLGAVDYLNSKTEPFLEPDMTYSILPELDTVKYRLENTRLKCESDLPRFIKSDVFYWNQLPNDLGDNCLWQGVYTAYLCTQGDIGSVNKSLLEAMVPLSTYGGRGALLRGVAAVDDVPHLKDDKNFFLYDGEWVCRSNPSMGSLLGFCYGLTYAATHPSLCGKVDPYLIKMIAAPVAESLLNNDYRLVNNDGSYGTWGNMSPGLFQAPGRLLGLLPIFKLAGLDKEYKKLYDRAYPFIPYGDTRISIGPYYYRTWYQEHLAFLTYDMLIRLEGDLAIKERYLQGLRRMWDTCRPLWNPYFTSIAAEHLSEDCVFEADVHLAVRALFDYDYPSSKNLPKLNSNRTDIEKIRYGKFLEERVEMSRRPLPVADRPPTDYLWQRNPYKLDGNPHAECNGLDFLFAYNLLKDKF